MRNKSLFSHLHIRSQFSSGYSSLHSSGPLSHSPISIDMAHILPRAPSPSHWACDTPSSTEAHSDGGSSQPEESRSQSPVRDSDTCSATTAALLEQLATGYRELWDQALDVLVAHHAFESEQGRRDDMLMGDASSLSESSLVEVIGKM